MAFDFIYGDDEYLTDLKARERWREVSEGLDGEFGVEVIDSRCQKIDEVEVFAKRLRESTQTVGLFGGTRAVWVKGINFIADSVVGRAEGTLALLEDIKPLLENADPKETRILVSASPIDRRLSFFKWLSSKGKAQEVASLEGIDPEKLGEIAKAKGLEFDADAADLFIRKVGGSARMVDSELEKLALYFDASAQKPKSVTQEAVIELTSAVAEGEFFEPLEAFYSRKAPWALQAVREYFSRKDNDARPILAAFFNRNRLLMMVKAAQEEGLCRAGRGGIVWTPKAEKMKAQMGTQKSPFNLFSQNPWYLGRLAQEAGRFELEELKSIQEELLGIFEKIHRQDQATVFEGFFVKWVAPRTKKLEIRN